MKATNGQRLGVGQREGEGRIFCRHGARETGAAAEATLPQSSELAANAVVV